MRTYFTVSRAFQANRWIDFVTITSISPFLHISIISLNSLHLRVLTPIIPSSANTRTGSQSGCCWFCLCSIPSGFYTCWAVLRYRCLPGSRQQLLIFYTVFFFSLRPRRYHRDIFSPMSPFSFSFPVAMFMYLTVIVRGTFKAMLLTMLFGKRCVISLEVFFVERAFQSLRMIPHGVLCIFIFLARIVTEWTGCCHVYLWSSGPIALSTISLQLCVRYLSFVWYSLKNSSLSLITRETPPAKIKFTKLLGYFWHQNKKYIFYIMSVYKVGITGNSVAYRFCCRNISKWCCSKLAYPICT